MSEDVLFRLRVRYVETGRLRYLSHLELLRALERTMRRADLPYAVTQGFSPRIKAAYCPALPVGVASLDEWFDVWLREYRPAEEYLALLQGAAVDDLMPCEASFVDVRSPSLSAALTLASWTLDVAARADGEGGRIAIDASSLQGACDAVGAAGEIRYLRNGKPRTVSLEGKFARVPAVREVDGADAVRIEMVTRASNEGALRPDVFLDAVIAQLAETSRAAGGPVSAAADDAVSCRQLVRADIVRTAQYLEGEDGSWVRPI